MHTAQVFMIVGIILFLSPFLLVLHPFFDKSGQVRSLFLEVLFFSGMVIFLVSLLYIIAQIAPRS
jgi:hypothetical protein